MSTLPTLGANPTPNFGYKPARKIPPTVWIFGAIGTAVIAVPIVIFVVWYAGSTFLSGKKLADAAVSHFHDELNAGQYDEIIAEADPGFSHSLSHDGAVLYLSDLHGDLGDAGAATFLSINMNSSTGEGTTVFCVYNTAFARGPAYETFIWKKYGSALKLYGYRVRSNALPQY
jgi:hypothetical protein